MAQFKVLRAHKSDTHGAGLGAFQPRMAQVRKNVADPRHQMAQNGVLRRRRHTNSPTCAK